MPLGKTVRIRVQAGHPIGSMWDRGVDGVAYHFDINGDLDGAHFPEDNVSDEMKANQWLVIEDMAAVREAAAAKAKEDAAAQAIRDKNALEAATIAAEQRKVAEEMQAKAEARDEKETPKEEPKEEPARVLKISTGKDPEA